jgi:predicted CXXCH cytochrome family protein
MKKWQLTIVSMAVFMLIFALGSAEAGQKYVKTTGKSCASCHDMAKIPTLNAFGKQFKANGYKIVAAKKAAIVKAGKAPAKVAAPAKVVAPKVVAQNDRKYVGSARCAMCHGAAYQGWKKSYHSKMVQKRDEGILKEAVTSWAADSAGNPGPTIGNATKEKVSILDVQYTIGNKWKQRYLVKNNQTGGLQLMNKQFNLVSKAWENYGNANDWDTECITCHSTGSQITKYDEKNPSATQVKYAELNVGCEACHGPGSAHVVSSGKVDIFNPAKQSKEVQARICGACHSRIVNEKFLTRQGKAREDLPAPTLNTSWKPWDDYTKWYPDLLIFPGVQPEDQLGATYAGDLKDMFFLDDQAKNQGIYEEKKHHQEYQGFIQSSHYKTTLKAITCTTCHNVHNRTAETGSLKAKPEELCNKCHINAAADFWQKRMPGTGKTANNLYVRSHTFVSGQSRPDAGPTAYGTPEPVYYFQK